MSKINYFTKIFALNFSFPSWYVDITSPAFLNNQIYDQDVGGIKWSILPQKAGRASGRITILKSYIDSQTVHMYLSSRMCKHVSCHFWHFHHFLSYTGHLFNLKKKLCRWGRGCQKSFPFLMFSSTYTEKSMSLSSYSNSKWPNLTNMFSRKRKKKLSMHKSTSLLP